MFTGS
ncbi:hypothetical protein YPPY47_2593, partial [Yersinia pestis PY-47]